MPKGSVKNIKKLQNKVCELNGIQSGLIRIGTFSSVATHWLPNIIKEFQKDYPNIDYELLLGDYTEIEEWIIEGRVDCGFEVADTSRFRNDLLRARQITCHPAKKTSFGQNADIPVAALCHDSFMLLEKGAKASIGNI